MSDLRWFTCQVDTGLCTTSFCIVAESIGEALEAVRAVRPNALRYDVRLASFLSAVKEPVCGWACRVCEYGDVDSCLSALTPSPEPD